MDILCHRGLWDRKKKSQNSIKSILEAFRQGYGVEIDLRLDQKGRIYLAHDIEEKPKVFFEDLMQPLDFSSEFKVLPTMALHIKEDNDKMFEVLCKTINPTNKLIIFGLSPESKIKYAEVFGWSRMAYELETGFIGNIKEAAKGPEGIVWIVERGWQLSKEDYDKIKHKKLYYITPEIIQEEKQLTNLQKDKLNGLCTDDPEFYKHLLK
jgi:glycerophosphoryl diester phosphodiesterase